MSNTTQAIQNATKITMQTNKNTKQTEASSSLSGFDNLFASAMSGVTPQAKLSTIQEELREALSSQEAQKKAKKSEEPSSLAVENQTSQAAIWAQRDWMSLQAASKSNQVSEENYLPTERPVTAAQSRPEKTNTESTSTSQTEKEVKADSSADKNKTKQNEDNKAEKNTDDPEGTTKQNQSLKQTVSDTNTEGKVSLEGLTATKETTTEDSDFAQKIAHAMKSKNDTAIDKTQASQNDAKNLKSTNTSKVEIDTKTGPANSHTDNNATALNYAAANGQQAQVKGSTESLNDRKVAVGDKILATNGTQSTTNPAAGLTGLQGGTQTAASTTVSIKTPVNQPGFAKELGQQINWSIGKNMSTVDIRVNPESFGPMNMRIIQKGQQIQLVIRTQDDASATMMTQALQGLKESMAQSGLQLNQIQIHSGETAQQGLQSQLSDSRQQGDQTGQQARQGSNNTITGNGTQTDEMPLNTANKPPRSSNNGSGLDLFA